MQINGKLKVAFRFALNYLKSKSPIDTGNLRYNAIKYRIDGEKFIIYVDEKVAPYMVYTNEVWIKRSGPNPNEDWWNKAVEDIIQTMAIYLKGELK